MGEMVQKIVLSGRVCYRVVEGVKVVKDVVG